MAEGVGDAQESRPVRRMHTTGGPDLGAIILLLMGAALLPLGLNVGSYPMVAFGAVLALLGGVMLMKRH